MNEKRGNDECECSAATSCYLQTHVKGRKHFRDPQIDAIRLSKLEIDLMKNQLYFQSRS